MGKGHSLQRKLEIYKQWVYLRVRYNLINNQKMQIKTNVLNVQIGKDNRGCGEMDKLLEAVQIT